jgi:ABC-type phosphate transport system substrate-binding protein
MRGVQASILLLWLCLLGLGGLAQAPQVAPYLVIVNAANPQSSLDRKFLSDAFLKKTTRWADGELIRPVDQSAESAVRRRFSEQVLNRSVTAVRSYWQQVIFSGRDVPPPELGGDSPVLEFVKNHVGAIGYVSGVAGTGGAKIIAVR